MTNIHSIIVGYLGNLVSDAACIFSGQHGLLDQNVNDINLIRITVIILRGLTVNMAHTYSAGEINPLTENFGLMGDSNSRL